MFLLLIDKHFRQRDRQTTVLNKSRDVLSVLSLKLTFDLEKRRYVVVRGCSN